MKPSQSASRRSQIEHPITRLQGKSAPEYISEQLSRFWLSQASCSCCHDLPSLWPRRPQQQKDPTFWLKGPRQGRFQEPWYVGCLCYVAVWAPESTGIQHVAGCGALPGNLYPCSDLKGPQPPLARARCGEPFWRE